MKKNILTISILSLVIIIIGTLYFSTANAQSGLITTNAQDTNGALSDVLSQKIVNKINILKAVTLDGKIFKDNIFLSLKDWSKPLPYEEAGRNNPFAPIGQ